MGERRGAPLANSLADGVYPLPGYSRKTFGGAEIVATESTIDELSAIVAKHGTLYSWARGQHQTRALSGRAPVFVASIPDQQQTTVVVRHSWHGGLLAPITGDRFRRPTRAPVELLQSFMLRECGIPTPEIIGFALYGAGPGFARVDVATRFVPESNDLAVVLANLDAFIGRDEALPAVTVLLNQLARHGFIHPDLNVKNILLHRQHSVVRAMVLDVDVVRWDQNLPAATVMNLNAQRLERSLIKARGQFGISFTETELAAFMRSLTVDVSGALHQ